MQRDSGFFTPRQAVLLGDGHLVEGGQRRKHGAADPGSKAALRVTDDLHLKEAALNPAFLPALALGVPAVLDSSDASVLLSSDLGCLRLLACFLGRRRSSDRFRPLL